MSCIGTRAVPTSALGRIPRLLAVREVLADGGVQSATLQKHSHPLGECAPGSLVDVGTFIIVAVPRQESRSPSVVRKSSIFVITRDVVFWTTPRLVPRWVRGFCGVDNVGTKLWEDIPIIKNRDTPERTRFTPAHGGAGNSHCFLFRGSANNVVDSALYFTRSVPDCHDVWRLREWFPVASATRVSQRHRVRPRERSAWLP